MLSNSTQLGRSKCAVTIANSASVEGCSYWHTWHKILRGSVQENQAVDESSLSHLFKISMKIDSWKPSYYNCHPYCFLEICIPLKNETAWVYGRPHLKDSTETRVPTPLSNRTSTATSNSQLESARTLKCMLHRIIPKIFCWDENWWPVSVL